MSVIDKFDALKEVWSNKWDKKVNNSELAAYIYSLLEAGVRVWLNHTEDDTSYNYPVLGIGPGCLICKTGNSFTIKCKYPKDTSGIVACRDGEYVPILESTIQIVRPRNKAEAFATELESYKPREIDDSLDL